MEKIIKKRVCGVALAFVPVLAVRLGYWLPLPQIGFGKGGQGKLMRRNTWRK